MIICIISEGYPDERDKHFFVFVKQLVDQWSIMGNECYVISPYNMLHNRRIPKSKWQYQVENEGVVRVFRPSYLSFGDGLLSKLGLSLLATQSHKWATQRAFKMLPKKPDVIYGHFWHSAFSGYKYAKYNHLPILIATGESEIEFRLPGKYESFRDYIYKVICVSSKNRDESISLGLTSEEKCIVIPNAVNSAVFRLKDKMACRHELGLPNDVFIVAFVGWFNHRKGATRVSEAITRTKDNSIYSIFLGERESLSNSPQQVAFEPSCDNILFKGRADHGQVADYLNAADVFCLPTLQEGCCNAVIEAMACGLPIISSNLPFNWDVLDESNSILVDPENIDEISSAIKLLKENPELRMRLSDGALKKASQLSLDRRASVIYGLLKDSITKKDE